MGERRLLKAIYSSLFWKAAFTESYSTIANHANYANWSQAQSVIAEVVEAINLFASTARDLGVAKETVVLITRKLNQAYEVNKLLVR